MTWIRLGEGWALQHDVIMMHHWIFWTWPIRRVCPSLLAAATVRMHGGCIEVETSWLAASISFLQAPGEAGWIPYLVLPASKLRFVVFNGNIFQLFLSCSDYGRFFLLINSLALHSFSSLHDTLIAKRPSQHACTQFS